MSKQDIEATETLDRQELDSVVGGAGPSLTALSQFQPRRGPVINPTNIDRDALAARGRDLMPGFEEPIVRPSERPEIVPRDWVSDSIQVQVGPIGWSKDYDDPPPEPQPKDPDGGTGGGGGGGGAPPTPPGDPDGGGGGRISDRLGNFDLDNVRLDRLGVNRGLTR